MTKIDFFLLYVILAFVFLAILGIVCLRRGVAIIPEHFRIKLNPPFPKVLRNFRFGRGRQNNTSSDIFCKKPEINRRGVRNK